MTQEMQKASQWIEQKLQKAKEEKKNRYFPNVEEHTGNVDLPDLRDAFVTLNKLRNRGSEGIKEKLPK